MATASQHIIQLLEKYTCRQATSGEVDELLTLLRTGNYDETVVSFIETHLETFEPDHAEDIAFWKNRLEGGAQKITGASVIENPTAVIDMPAQVRPVHRVHFLRKWGWVAASIILALGIGTYFWTTGANNTTPSTAATPAVHIPPGKSGAILTLADGTQVVLDSLGNGVVATQNGTKVLLKGGGLAYHPTSATTSQLMYNTMTTPRGRQFQVTLPDGTRVWLNAASSLRYPTVFTGNERKVYITGEAYFEVSHLTSPDNGGKRIPFIVDILPPTGGAGGGHIEVLGTHFNVNAYDNEPAISTTLLEGSVRVSQAATGNKEQDQSAVTIRPGQQAQVMRGIKVINNIDIDKVMSWKNGLFNFEGASFREIMRQVERWYDIEVAYEKGVPDIEFEGKMTKDVPLKDLLVMLERSDIHFRVDGRKLIVLP